jgi:hypothetical protein
MTVTFDGFLLRKSFRDLDLAPANRDAGDGAPFLAGKMAGCAAYAAADVEHCRAWRQLGDLHQKVDQIDLCCLFGFVCVEEIAVVDVLAPKDVR